MSKQQLNGTSEQENLQTEPPVGGFAIGGLPVQTVEQDTSSLPQTKAECFSHEIWGKSKHCVV